MRKGPRDWRITLFFRLGGHVGVRADCVSLTSCHGHLAVSERRQIIHVKFSLSEHQGGELLY
jgi:hypothetical protein